MKKIVLFFALILAPLITVHAQNEFDIEPSQSMLMTGKGPGQDATINPYTNEDCYTYINNMGEFEFSVRIQKKGEVIDTYIIGKGETKKIVLLKDQELYLDGNDKEPTKAKITYKKMVAY